jgi:hypothetical protein
LVAWALQVGQGSGIKRSEREFAASGTRNRRTFSSSQRGSANVKAQEDNIGVSMTTDVVEPAGLIQRIASVLPPNQKSSGLEQGSLGPNNIKRLSKILSKNLLDQPVYATKPETKQGQEEAPDKGFVCEIKAGGQAATGRGMSKVEAEQDAAGKILQAFVSMGLMEDNQSSSSSGKRLNSFTLRPPPNAEWIRIDPKRQKLKPILQERDVPIPELAHGLSRVISKSDPFATTLKHKIGGKFFDRDYCTCSSCLSHIHVGFFPVICFLFSHTMKTCKVRDTQKVFHVSHGHLKKRKSFWLVFINFMGTSLLIFLSQA